MLVQSQPKFYTPEDYLALEEAAIPKHEYRDRCDLYRTREAVLSPITRMRSVIAINSHYFTQSIGPDNGSTGRDWRWGDRLSLGRDADIQKPRSLYHGS